MAPADLARLSDVSPASVMRVLKDQPARARPSLQKLHKFVAGTQPSGLSSTLSALGRFTHGKKRHDTAAAAQILRALADLLDSTGTG